MSNYAALIEFTRKQAAHMDATERGNAQLPPLLRDLANALEATQDRVDALARRLEGGGEG